MLNTVVGMLTVAKFHNNADTDSFNKVISRTLGKFGLIDKDYAGEYPKPEEFWVVKIKKNIKPDKTEGCFILEPLKKLDFTNDVGKLAWGMYSIEEIGKAVTIIRPNQEYQNKYWQLPLEERKHFKNKAVIVIQNEKLLEQKEVKDEQ
jgi:hypothetical protein